MSQSDWDHIESYKQAIIDGRVIADIWGTNDVLAEYERSSPREQLNEDDAKQILKNVQRYKDADHGINWIVIDSHIDDYLENREENNNA
jgi:hypothetical protein